VSFTCILRWASLAVDGRNRRVSQPLLWSLNRKAGARWGAGSLGPDSLDRHELIVVRADDSIRKNEIRANSLLVWRNRLGRVAWSRGCRLLLWRRGCILRLRGPRRIGSLAVINDRPLHGGRRVAALGGTLFIAYLGASAASGRRAALMAVGAVRPLVVGVTATVAAAMPRRSLISTEQRGHGHEGHRKQSSEHGVFSQPQRDEDRCGLRGKARSRRCAEVFSRSCARGRVPPLRIQTGSRRTTAERRLWEYSGMSKNRPCSRSLAELHSVATLWPLSPQPDSPGIDWASCEKPESFGRSPRRPSPKTLRSLGFTCALLQETAC